VDYQAAVDWILGFADYERCPGFAYASRFDLRRMEELLKRLGEPHLKPRAVHIAGTKGKGSTGAMIASGLRAAGFKVGFYTSPHLHTIRERICFNGQPITESDFAQLAAKLKPVVDEVNRGAFGQLTTFEVLTALGFLYFQEAEADFQVIEVGLGGRLDATNVVCPEICLITSISRDHTQVLGDTLPQIATEKAGIIKTGALTISAPQRPEVSEVIEKFCAQKGSPLLKVGEQVTWQELEISSFSQSLEVEGVKDSYKLSIPLLGRHQLENAATAIAALEALGLSPDTISSGLSRVSWPGRLEVLAQEPWLVVDGAHNADSAAKLREALKRHFHFVRAALIFAASWDKDISGAAAELAPFFELVVMTRSHHPRAADPLKLAPEFEKYAVPVEVTENAAQALAKARAQVGKEDLICVTGSLFIAAEARGLVKGLPVEYYPLQKPAAVRGKFATS